MQPKFFLKILLLTMFSAIFFQGCKKKTDDLTTSKTTGTIDDAVGITVSVKHSLENGEYFVTADLFQNPYTASSRYIKTTSYVNRILSFEIPSNGTSALKNGDYTVTPVGDHMHTKSLDNSSATGTNDYTITFTGISSKQTYTVSGTFALNLPADTGFGSPRRHAIFINKTGNTYTITQ